MSLLLIPLSRRSVAEFLLPLLVLDVLCFGNEDDGVDVIEEISVVLKARGGQLSERRRAINTVFEIIDTLEGWREEEFAVMLAGRALPREGDWPSDESIERIQMVSYKVPLSVRASAAISIGNHARAVRNLELKAREFVVGKYYGASGEEEDWVGVGGGIGGGEKWREAKDEGRRF